jgi:hypothetical protein
MWNITYANLNANSLLHVKVIMENDIACDKTITDKKVILK